MSEKLIVLWRGESTRDLSDGLAVYADGKWMLHYWEQVASEAGCYPIEEPVPPGPRLMVWEGEQVGGPLRSPDSEPVFRGLWRAATADDLIDADLLGGLE